MNFNFQFLKIFFSLLLVSVEVNSQNLKSDIIILDKIRFEHFENGSDFDSIKVQKYTNNKSSELSRYAKLLMVTYKFENYRSAADNDLLNILTSSDWLSNENTKNEELLLIDDLFRVCMSTMRYKTFSVINLALYRDKSELLIPNLLYFSYTALKSGNLYKFYDNQIYLKSALIKYKDSIHIFYGQKYLSRIKANICAIDLYNFDTTNQNSFNELLLSLYDPNSKNNSEIEDLCFNFRFLLYSYNNPTLFKQLTNYAFNDILEWDKFANNGYVSPFIFELITLHGTTLKRERDYLNTSYISFYKNINLKKTLLIKAKLFEYDRIQSADTIGLFLGRLIQGIKASHNVTIELQKELYDLSAEVYPDILSKNFIIEPNWLTEKISFLTLSEYNNLYIDTAFFIKNSNIEINQQILSNLRINDSSYEEVKLNDYSHLFDCTNYFYSYYHYKYLHINKDYFSIISDSLLFMQYDSIYQVVNYIVKYWNPISSVTADNLFITNFLNRSFILLKEYFLYTKKIDYYKTVLFLEYDLKNKANNKKLSNTIYTYLDIEAYLALKNTFSDSELKENDMEFLNLFKQTYLDSLSPQEIIEQNAYYVKFSDPSCKGLFLDMYKRGNINDSILIQSFILNELNNIINSRMIETYNHNYFLDDSLISINQYQNDIFCIDNSDLKFRRKGNDIYSIFKMIQNDSITSKKASINYVKSIIDQSSNYILYFIVDNNDAKNIYSNSFHDFNYVTKKDLYLVYLGKNGEQSIHRLISLDSLKMYFDFSVPFTNGFFDAVYLDYLKENSKYLFDIFFGKIYDKINNNEKYKILLPNELVTIPLDYVYANNASFLPYFEEYTSFFNALFKGKSIYLDRNDTISVFSELIYNDNYCNINKSNLKNRGGISPLKYSKSERDSINIVIKTHDYKGINANKHNFIKTLIDTTVSFIHLITHGSFIPNIKQQISADYNDKIRLVVAEELPNNNERQFLIFSSDSIKKSEKNKIMTAAEIEKFENLSHIKCIYLSACETGLNESDQTANSGYSGFIQKFLERGVKAVLATRWKVDDLLASKFAGQFYSTLNRVKDLSKAFYELKRQMYENKTFSDIWPAYVLVQ